jgi:hypothetical protein
MVIVDEITNHAGGTANHHATGKRANEANDDQLRDRGGEGTGNDHDDEEEQADYADWFSAVSLTQGSHHHRPEGEPNEIEGQAQGDNCLGRSELCCDL